VFSALVLYQTAKVLTYRRAYHGMAATAHSKKAMFSGGFGAALSWGKSLFFHTKDAEDHRRGVHALAPSAEGAGSLRGGWADSLRGSLWPLASFVLKIERCDRYAVAGVHANPDEHRLPWLSAPISAPSV
jgi:hypothetical protein